MDLNSKIDSIRVYQAVTFEKRSETFFSTRDINTKGGKVITINEKYHGIEIKSDLDHIFVPFTNISCVYFLSEIKEEQIRTAEKGKTKKTGLDAAEIKRPR